MISNDKYKLSFLEYYIIKNLNKSWCPENSHTTPNPNGTRIRIKMPNIIK